MTIEYNKIIDISQPISSRSACFPGDVPFSKQVTVTYRDSQVINLTALTMSPHVGTHIDAPAHIKGDMDLEDDLAAGLPLDAFIGATLVIDLSPHCKGIEWDEVKSLLPSETILPPRILFKTQAEIRYEIFEDEYSYFTPELVAQLKKRGVCLLGIDTPSVDHVRSKTLDTHHCLDKSKMVWIENLDLTSVKPGRYTLIALPLKFVELEASPIRAILLE